MWYSNDMFHHVFKAEFVTLVSLKVPSGVLTAWEVSVNAPRTIGSKFP